MTRERLNALTIDLEDWYQGLTSTGARFHEWPRYEDRVVANTRQVLDILAEKKVKATFFVLGYAAEQFPDLIREVAEAGHEIGLHSYRHQAVSRMTPEEFRRDVARGLAAVQAASGSAVSGYRAPMFSINKSSLWALDILREMGFRYDSSIFPTYNFLYGYPDAPRAPYRPFGDDSFTEFPLSTVRVSGINVPVAGGFYLRLFPYPFIKWAVERINRQGTPAVIYLHPWDLDPGQPYPNPTLRERFTHYYNLGKMKARLTALLDDFQFAPLQQLLPDLSFASRGPGQKQPEGACT